MLQMQINSIHSKKEWHHLHKILSSVIQYSLAFWLLLVYWVSDSVSNFVLFSNLKVLVLRSSIQACFARILLMEKGTLHPNLSVISTCSSRLLAVLLACIYTVLLKPALAKPPLWLIGVMISCGSKVSLSSCCWGGVAWAQSLDHLLLSCRSLSFARGHDFIISYSLMS